MKWNEMKKQWIIIGRRDAVMGESHSVRFVYAQFKTLKSMDTHAAIHHCIL